MADISALKKMQEDIYRSKSVRYKSLCILRGWWGGKARLNSKLFWWGIQGPEPGISLFYICPNTKTTVYNYLTSCYTYHSFCLCSSANLYHYTRPFFFLSLQRSCLLDVPTKLFNPTAPKRLPRHNIRLDESSLNRSDDYHVLLDLQPFQPTYLNHASNLTSISNESEQAQSPQP